MPNRIIKESICTSDSVDGLSWFEEAFFYRLIVNCDDYGRMDARSAILRSRLFPLKSVTDKQIEGALQSLRTVGIVYLYEVDGKPYLQLRTWDKHQSVRAHKSKYPSPDDENLTSASSCKQMISDASKCPRNPIQSESNPIRESESYSNASIGADKPPRSRFVAPTLEEITAECSANGYSVDPNAFFDYYTANGWMAGRVKMKDWKATLRNWNRRERENGQQTGSGNVFLDMLEERRGQ